MADLTALRSSLRTGIGNPVAADVSDVALTEHINNAYQDICDRFSFYRTRKRVRWGTVQNEDKYVLPADFAYLIEFWDRTNKQPIVQKGTRKLSRTDYIDVETGKPLEYVITENYVQLFPPADAIYQLEMLYKVVVGSLNNGGDVPVIPVSWHHGIVLLAKWYYYNNDNLDTAKATMAYNTYQLWVKDKSVEMHEAMKHVDQAVEVPTLGGDFESRRLDFDHSE